MSSIFDEFDIMLSKYIEPKYPETITIPRDMIDCLETTTRLHNGKRVDCYGKEVDKYYKRPDHEYIYAKYPLFITNKGYVRILYGYRRHRGSSDINIMLYYKTYFNCDITLSQFNRIVELYLCIIPSRTKNYTFDDMSEEYREHIKIANNITNFLKREFGS